MAHAGMVSRREQEAEAGLVEQRPRLGGRQVDRDAERLEHIGRAAARADGGIAVLGHRLAAGGDDEGGGGGDVDQAGAIAAGAATVGEQIIGPLERLRRREQAARGPDHLVGRLAFHPERDQHAGNLGRLEPAKHQSLEQMLGFVGGQVVAGKEARQWIRHWSLVDDRVAERRMVKLGMGKHGLLAWLWA